MASDVTLLQLVSEDVRRHGDSEGWRRRGSLRISHLPDGSQCRTCRTLAWMGEERRRDRWRRGDAITMQVCAISNSRDSARSASASACFNLHSTIPIRILPSHNRDLVASAGPRPHPSHAGDTRLGSAQSILGGGVGVTIGFGGIDANAAVACTRTGRNAGCEVAGLKTGTWGGGSGALGSETGFGRVNGAPTGIVGRLSRESIASCEWFVERLV
jgi:hypothetical protein